MKKLYITQEAPNGTSALIIADQDGQIIDVIDEAVFGLYRHQDTMDQIGGVNAIANGESVIYFESNHEAYQWNDETETEELLNESAEDILYRDGEYCGAELVQEVSLDQVLKHIAVSPVSDGSVVIKTLNK